MKKLSVLLALIMISCFSSEGLSNKQLKGDLSEASTSSAVELNHQAWTKLLQKHVTKKGLVDYKGFQKDREKLDDYVKYLSKQEPKDDWSIQEQLAFYINAYNAFTVQYILDNYPLESIKDIGSALNSPFIQERFEIGGKQLSLADIEKGILTKMNEPRIHFAINCASISCPKLMDEAFTAKNIDQQLTKATSDFINSDKNDLRANPPKVSKIFKWYSGDFEKDGQSVIDFINKFADQKIDTNAKLKYLDYDWSLNEAK